LKQKNRKSDKKKMVKIDEYAGQKEMEKYAGTPKPKTARDTKKLDSELYEGQKRMQNMSDAVSRDIKTKIDSMFGEHITPTQKKAMHKNGIAIEQGGATRPAVARWMKGDKSF
jgi:hypothetical protein